jgi:hypothetical protein
VGQIHAGPACPSFVTSTASRHSAALAKTSAWCRALNQFAPRHTLAIRLSTRPRALLARAYRAAWYGMRWSMRSLRNFPKTCRQSVTPSRKSSWSESRTGISRPGHLWSPQPPIHRQGVTRPAPWQWLSSVCREGVTFMHKRSRYRPGLIGGIKWVTIGGACTGLTGSLECR